jgi:hypothetical protein
LAKPLSHAENETRGFTFPKKYSLSFPELQPLQLVKLLLLLVSKIIASSTA